jgi:hypothetical protein
VPSSLSALTSMRTRAGLLWSMGCTMSSGWSVSPDCSIQNAEGPARAGAPTEPVAKASSSAPRSAARAGTVARARSVQAFWAAVHWATSGESPSSSHR